MSQQRLLEICVFNIDTAIAVEKAGADRIELCENYNNGGTTPSYGYLKMVRGKINIPVFPMIRPRGGDFYHTPNEIEIILKDVLMCKDLGFQGVVIGLLNKNGTIDTDNTARLVEAAYPLEVTFHRAFDRCKNPLEALETIIETGCSRILTSGQMPKVTEGLDLVKTLVDQSNGRIIIMPGSGLNSGNVQHIIETSKVTEVHTSARITLPSLTEYRNPHIQENFENDFVNVEEIQRIKSIIA